MLGLLVGIGGAAFRYADAFSRGEVSGPGELVAPTRVSRRTLVYVSFLSLAFFSPFSRFFYSRGNHCSLLCRLFVSRLLLSFRFSHSSVMAHSRVRDINPSSSTHTHTHTHTPLPPPPPPHTHTHTHKHTHDYTANDTFVIFQAACCHCMCTQTAFALAARV
jgi:hypothetical protein